MSESGGGRYVYGIVEFPERFSLGRIGLDEQEVYILPCEGLGAVVHDCSATPYVSEDEHAIRGWAVRHQAVVDAVIRKFGMVLPMRFGTIIRDTEKGSAEENIRAWLTSERDEFRGTINRLRGHDEYGVQIFWDPAVIAKSLSKDHPEIAKIEADMRSGPSGLAYMQKLKLGKLVKREMEKQAEAFFKDFYRRIKERSSEVKVEPIKKGSDKPMLANLSCLVRRGAVQSLANELEEINSMKGFSVRFTGPWPPYSFVTLK